MSVGLRGVAVLAAGFVLAGIARGEVVFPKVTYSYTTTEVLAGTESPSNMSPGVIEPGEGVRITISMTWDQAIGSTGTFSTFFGPVAGKVVGWKYSNFTFIPPMEFIDHSIENPGSIDDVVAGPGFKATMALAFLTPNLDVETIDPSGVPANTFTPLVSFTWIPGDFTPRTVDWYAADHGLAGGATGIGHAFTVQHPGPGGVPILDTGIGRADFGKPPSIVVVPAPGVLGMGFVASLVASLRRR